MQVQLHMYRGQDRAKSLQKTYRNSISKPAHGYKTDTIMSENRIAGNKTLQVHTTMGTTHGTQLDSNSKKSMGDFKKSSL